MAEKPATFTLGGAKRIVAATRRMEAMPNYRGRGQDLPQFVGSSRPIPAKITAVDPSTGEFEAEQVLADGTTKTGGVVWDGGASPNRPKLVAINGIPWVPVDSIWLVRRGIDSADPPATVWYIDGFTPHATFAVDLTKTGGADGNATTAPTYTYTVNDLDGNELGTGVGPEFARANGKFDAGTKGIAYYLADGTLKLMTVDEIEATEECE